MTPPTRPLGAGADDDRPTRSVTLQLPAPNVDTAARKVWNAAGEVLGTGLATLYGRVGVGPDELRRSAAAALAMADVLEQGDWTDPRECYCCSCPSGGWDGACRQHGAHGLRPCARHGRSGHGCDCGCGETETPEPAGTLAQVSG